VHLASLLSVTPIAAALLTFVSRRRIPQLENGVVFACRTSPSILSPRALILHLLHPLPKVTQASARPQIHGAWVALACPIFHTATAVTRPTSVSLLPPSAWESSAAVAQVLRVRLRNLVNTVSMASIPLAQQASPPRNQALSTATAIRPGLDLRPSLPKSILVAVTVSQLPRLK
jgi:hypothetical protein